MCYCFWEGKNKYLPLSLHHSQTPSLPLSSGRSEQLYQHLLGFLWAFCSFFLSGTVNPFSPLYPANSHHFFYLPCPQPSRLLLFPYSIMGCHLARLCISSSKHSTWHVVHIYLKECSLHFLMPSHIYSLLCPHGRGHCL